MVRVGTSGWYYDHWRGHLYPEALKKEDFFAYYAQRYSTVEINSTFYRVPTERMVEGWARKAPPGFLFAAKGARLITHRKRLAEVDETLRFFLGRLQGLGAKLGPLLWQLPPSLQRDDARLRGFLERLPREYRHAIEFRHSSWLEEAVFALLREHNVAFCAISLPGFPPTLVRTAPFVYIRFHGVERRYSDHYTEDALKPWVDKLAEALSPQGEGFCYFNNDVGGHAVRDAARFREMLNEAGVEAR